MDSGVTASDAAPPAPSHRRLRIGLPAVLGGLGLAWWMCNVAFWTLGVFQTDSIGHRAWRAGFRVPNWFRIGFPYVGMAAWIGSTLLIGALVTLHGARVWRPIAGVLATATVGAMLASVVVGPLVWPDGF